MYYTTTCGAGTESPTIGRTSTLPRWTVTTVGIAWCLVLGARRARHWVCETRVGWERTHTHVLPPAPARGSPRTSWARRDGFPGKRLWCAAALARGGGAKCRRVGYVTRDVRLTCGSKNTLTRAVPLLGVRTAPCRSSQRPPPKSVIARYVLRTVVLWCILVLYTSAQLSECVCWSQNSRCINVRMERRVTISAARECHWSLSTQRRQKPVIAHAWVVIGSVSTVHSQSVCTIFSYKSINILKLLPKHGKQQSTRSAPRYLAPNIAVVRAPELPY